MTNIVCRRWAVDLATLSLPLSLSQLVQAVAAVQPEERTRLIKFCFLDDFLSSLIGRLLMRKFVSDSTGIDYHAVQFGRDARGKPYLDIEKSSIVGGQQSLRRPPAQISFNVSHQGDLVVLAGLMSPEPIDSANTTDCECDFGIGVDVMKIEYSGGRPLTEFFRLMHRKFSDNEWRYINRRQHNDMDKLKAFMRHWCLKESYVKELGVGITVDLQKISFTVDSDAELELNATLPLTNTSLRCNDVPMFDWHFEEHLLKPKYCAAIAYRNCRPTAGNFEMLSLEDLLVKHPTAKAEDAEIVNYCRDVLKKQRK